ncbi:MAG TPA: phosphoribosylformylglycinamidine synthase subunit PurL, partial [Candidatus Marinimicrobia bacterium]|nr:phosphoribosylformylglycinamidine synthase subunit PurL [Candidatus Neomarinimicrobiota bacterium]
YGNCLGIPTVGGEVVIEDSYSGNCLVNAMSLGIVETKYVSSAIAKGVGNPVYIVGSTTGRDGIHGATFASVELTEETESKRSNVQVGDPFTEKLLMEASLELCKKLWLVGIQDMGAAGITCSCSEMSAKGESGIKIDLDKVPLREDSMNAYEIMLSESQERMLVVIEQGFDKELNAIFEKWELDCTRVGEVTDTGMLEVYHRGNKVAEIPSEELVLGGGAPQYDMPVREPAYFSEINNFTIDAIQEEEDYNKTLLTLLSTPNITSKQFVFRQYDSTVRSNTVQGPGGAAAVIRLKGTQKGLAMSTDCNGRYVYLNPRMGGQIAVVESARNVVCSGGEPLAITNCLNFGNPQDPEIYWQFKEAVTGIGEACRALNTPVTGGNVSFYNETGDTAVYPTPVIGMVGLLENINQSTTIEFKGAGDFIVTLGALNGCLGGSEYLRTIHGKIQGPIPHLNLELEMGIQELCLEAIKKGIIKSAHDLSDGGLAVNISESIVHSKQGLGARLDVVRKLQNNELLFGECQSVIVVTLEESALYELILLAQKLDMHTQTIGRVTDTNSLVINDQINISRIKMENAYFNSLEKIMTQ